MKIWVDADACPRTVKEIIFRAAERTRTEACFVANQYLQVPSSPYIKCLQVGMGFDEADHKIVELCAAGDLVITADIPLADSVIKKGATALNPRGQIYDANNIAPILATRNFMQTQRSGLNETIGGPRALTVKDREIFANALDKYISRKR